MAHQDDKRPPRPTTPGYDDVTMPFQESELPEHLRFADAQKGQPQVNDDDDEMNAHIVKTKPPVENFDDLPEDTRKRLRELGVTSAPADVNDIRDPNVIGINPESQRFIVRPKKREGSVFKPLPAISAEAFQGKSFEEVQAHLKQITDYKPMTMPSKGFLYPKSSPYASGDILVRPMRSEEEEIILNAVLAKEGQAVEMIFSRCAMVGQGVMLSNPMELLSQDRTALAIMIRGLTMGTIYEATYNCGRCGKVFETPIDLDNDLDSNFCNDPSISEPFRTILPQSRLTVEYRLPRGIDDHAVMEHIDERKKKLGVKSKEDGLYFKACRLVTGMQGCSSQEQVEIALRTMGAQDINHLRHLMDFPPFGVDTSIIIECPHCHSETVTTLPINLSFFSPQLERRRKREQNP